MLRRSPPGPGTPRRPRWDHQRGRDSVADLIFAPAPGTGSTVKVRSAGTDLAAFNGYLPTMKRVTPRLGAASTGGPHNYATVSNPRGERRPTICRTSGFWPFSARVNTSVRYNFAIHPQPRPPDLARCAI